MKKFISLLSVLLFSAAAVAQTGGTYTGPNAPGQLNATQTNDNALVGSVGEYVAVGSTLFSTTATITIASPGVVTAAVPISTAGPFGNNPPAGCYAVNFTTTGALPTGLSVATNYYIITSSISGTSFQLATTCANAATGVAIATSGTQSGVHTITSASLQTTATLNTYTGVVLSPGDWDVECQGVFRTTATTSVTSFSVSIDAQNIINAGSYWASAANVPGVADIGLNAGPYRVSQNVSSLHFCQTFPTFTASTLQTWGSIRARRVR